MHHADATSIIGPDRPWLAPLAGYTNLPFRLLCLEHGASAACTEMVSAKGLMYESKGTTDLLDTCPEDDPLVVQLFGAEPSFMAEAMEYCLDRGFTWFDLNAGCPVKKVVKTGAGAALLTNIERLLAVAGRMIELAPPGHVGVKIRTGWTHEEPVYIDLARRLEDLGAGWVTLHPRSARQAFSGHADWSCLARLKEAVSIPVIASGDLFKAEDGVRCIRETGVDGVMFARGALYDPAIFNTYLHLLGGGERPDPSPLERRDQLMRMIRRHIALERGHGIERRAFRRMRSLVPRYARSFPHIRELRDNICRCEGWEELDKVLDDFFQRHLPDDPATGS